MLRVTSAIRDAVCPDITMFVECRNDVMDEKYIVCVTVQRGTAGPYYLRKKESGRRVFMFAREHPQFRQQTPPS